MAKTDEYEWDNVVEESPTQIQFESPGEFIVGEYVKTETIPFVDKTEEKEFQQIMLRGLGIGDLEKGTLYGINCGYKLRKASEQLEPGKVIKVTYVKDVDTGAQQPMKDFKIDVAR